MTVDKPDFFLPVIVPPAQGVVPKTHYASLSAIVVAEQSGTDEGIAINVSPIGLDKLYSMFDGWATYYPAGKTLPHTTETAPTGGAVVVEPFPSLALRQLAWQLPNFLTIGTTIYTGVIETTVRSAFSTLVSAMSRVVKETWWRRTHPGQDPSTVTDASLDIAHLNALMAGTTGTSVQGGDLVGKFVLVFELRCISGSATPAYFSPAHVIRFAPKIDPRWSFHPLVREVQHLPGPIDPLPRQMPPVAQASDLQQKGGHVYGPGGRKCLRLKPGRTTVQEYGTTTISAFVATNPSRFASYSPQLLRVLEALSQNEGNFEAVNTWDPAFLSLGFVQWTLGKVGGEGELPPLLSRLKADYSTVFNDLFGVHGITVDAWDPTPATAVRYAHLTLNGQVLNTAALKKQMSADIWAYRFWRAGHHDDVRATQIKHAIERLNILGETQISCFINASLNQVMSLKDIITSEYGVALILDQHTNMPADVKTTVKKAGLAFIAAGGSSDPTTWQTAQEADLLQRYVTERNDTGMWDPDGRAAKTLKRVPASLSPNRGTYPW